MIPYSSTASGSAKSTAHGIAALRQSRPTSRGARASSPAPRGTAARRAPPSPRTPASNRLRIVLHQRAKDLRIAAIPLRRRDQHQRRLLRGHAIRESRRVLLPWKNDRQLVRPRHPGIEQERPVQALVGVEADLDRVPRRSHAAPSDTSARSRAPPRPAPCVSSLRSTQPVRGVWPRPVYCALHRAASPLFLRPLPQRIPIGPMLMLSHHLLAPQPPLVHLLAAAHAIAQARSPRSRKGKRQPDVVHRDDNRNRLALAARGRHATRARRTARHRP